MIIVNQNGHVHEQFIDIITTDKIQEILGTVESYKVNLMEITDHEGYPTGEKIVLIVEYPPDPNKIGGVFDRNFIICEYIEYENRYAPLKNNVTDYEWLRYFKCRINDHLEIYLIDKWTRLYNFPIIKYQALFQQDNLKVELFLSGVKSFLWFRTVSLDFELKFLDKIGMDFWNGTMPKEIYADYIKELDLYNFALFHKGM